MKEEFVTYDQALALKELGFDEDCLMYIDDEEDLINDDTAEWIGAVKAPLKSQAFEFFREKYGLHSFVDIYPTKEEPNRCWFMIRYIDRSIEEEEDYMSGWFSCQDKAEIYCLDKLIEIVKKQQI